MTGPSNKCYDAAIWQNLPHQSLVMLYKDGNYAVPPSAPVTLQASGVRYITVTGDYRGCGAIDWEPGNPCFTPAGLRGYVRGRRGINAVARAYCNRANASEAISYLED